MCPVCLSSAAAAAGATSLGGVVCLWVRKRWRAMRRSVGTPVASAANARPQSVPAK